MATAIPSYFAAVLLLLFILSPTFPVVVGDLTTNDQLGQVYKSAVATDAAAATLRMGIMLSNTSTEEYSARHMEALGRTIRYLQTERNVSVVHELYFQGTDNQTLSAMRDWASRNFTVIFSGSGSYTDVTTSYMAEDNKTLIATWGSVVPDYRTESFDNLAWQSTYLAGVACGMATKTKKIGWLGYSITRSAVRNLNAFNLGATSVNRNIKVYSTYTNVLFDPLLEARSTQKLIDYYNVDCVLGSDYGLSTFAKLGLPSIGFNGDSRYLVGENVWFSVENDWTSTYRYVVDRILNGTFGGAKKNYGALGDSTDITPFSPVTPLQVQTEIINRRAGLISGSLQLFCGVEATSLGFNLSTPTSCLTNSQIRSMSTFHPNIINDRNITYDDIYEYIYVKDVEGMAIALYTIASVALAVCILFAVLIGKYWHTAIIRYASPPFLLTMCIAYAVGLLSVFTWLGEPTTLTCQLRIWMLGVAFAVGVGALVVKNYRIWRIFANDSLKIFAITNKQLGLALLGIVAPILVILIIWTAVDPFVPVNVPSQYIEQWQFYKRCGSKSVAGPIVFVIAMALLVVALCFISYKTGKIAKNLKNSSGNTTATTATTNDMKSHMKDDSTMRAYYFVESVQIGYIAYTIVLLGLVALGIVVGIQYTPDTEALTFSILFIVMFVGLLLCIIGIKLYRIIWLGDNHIHSTSSSPSGTNPSSGKLSTVAHRSSSHHGPSSVNSSADDSTHDNTDNNKKKKNDDDEEDDDDAV